MSSIAEIKSKIQEMKGSRNTLLSQQSKAKDDKREFSIQGRKLEEAQTIIRTVALQTQRELQYHISSIVTSALEAVFPDPYEFVLEFIERRGRTEAEIYFLKNGERIDPMTGSGGGAVEVAAFALRASIWRLQSPLSMSTLIIDEPFTKLSKDLQPRAGQMLKEISQRLGLQIIMVTHSDDLIEVADKGFEVTQSNGVSKVEGV